MTKFFSVFLKVIAFLPGAIMGVEALKGPGNGSDKASVVLGLVQSIMSSIDPGSIHDMNAFNDGLKKVNDGVVQCLNASVWSK